MSKISQIRLPRRNVLAGLAGSTLLPLASPYIQSARAAGRLVVRDAGGVVNDAATKAFYQPFSKEAGVEVVGVTSQLEPIAQIRTIVDSKSYIWDVALLSLQAQGILGKAGYLEEVDQSAPGIADILPEAKSKWGVAFQIYATIFAYNTQTFGDKGPQNWADVFDVKKFPGRRSLRKYPIDTLEAAAMAAGKTVKDVYPLDLDLAFNKLTEIKPHVNVWWSNGAQASQMVSTKEVDIVSTYNGRVQVAIDDGAPFRIVWNQGIWAPDGYAIPKGGPNNKLAHDFLKFCARPDRQAEYSKWVPYSPGNPKAFEHIAPDRAKLLPTTPERVGNMVMENGAYWADNLEKVNARFNEWIIK